MAAIKSASLGVTYRREKAERGAFLRKSFGACFLHALLRHTHSNALDPVLFQKHGHSLGRETNLRLCADGAGPVEPDPAGTFLEIKIDQLGRNNPT